MSSSQIVIGVDASVSVCCVRCPCFMASMSKSRVIHWVQVLFHQLFC